MTPERNKSDFNEVDLLIFIYNPYSLSFPQNPPCGCLFLYVVLISQD